VLAPAKPLFSQAVKAWQEWLAPHLNRFETIPSSHYTSGRLKRLRVLIQIARATDGIHASSRRQVANVILGRLERVQDTAVEARSYQAIVVDLERLGFVETQGDPPEAFRGPHYTVWTARAPRTPRRSSQPPN
jgi:hypothetical protein